MREEQDEVWTINNPDEVHVLAGYENEGSPDPGRKVFGLRFVLTSGDTVTFGLSRETAVSIAERLASVAGGPTT